MYNIYLFAYLVIIAFYLCYRYLEALHMTQQNRYEAYRMKQWMKTNKIIHFIDLQWLCLSLILLGLSYFDYLMITQVFIYFILVWGLLLTIDFIKSQKEIKHIKPLVITNRVKRQIITIIIFALLIILASIFYKQSIFLLSLFGFNSGYIMRLVLVVNEPIEKHFRNQFINEAKKKIQSMNQMVKIGITGSYGKTSSKNILQEVLQEQFYSLMTPASFNTPMGITRTIREMLKPMHQVFICEMGADKVGEITELMAFVEPTIGVLTSIGPQHLNTFLSIENIIHEKFQVIEKLPKDGLGIINLDQEYVRSYKIQNTCKIITYAIYHDADLMAKDIVYSKNGTTFNLYVKELNQTYAMQTKLLGEHNVANILAAIAVAWHLGVSFEQISKAIQKVNYIPHRLELKHQGQLTILDNAFNSNPVGSKMSLDVLGQMEGYRIIMTPGMIDLGDSQDAYNYEFGQYMIHKADLVILVGPIQTKAIYLGLKDAGYNMDHVVVVDHVMDGFNHVYQLKEQDPILLIENDLPDAFNK